MASFVGRIQRLLRTLGCYGAVARRHRDDLGALLRCVRTHACAGRGARRKIDRPGALPLPSQHDGHCASCYMQDLFTSETARGKGVGRALIDEVYEEARVAGAPRVYWQTHETNAHGHAALRQGRGALRLSRLSQAVLTRSLWGFHAAFGDEARATIECCIGPGPIEEDDDAVAEADQEPQMREAPQQPGEEAASAACGRDRRRAALRPIVARLP